MKYITILVDFEGKWGMPYNSNYDLVKTTHRLLEVLDTYGVKAVFFVVGKIIEEYPDVIKEVAGDGHEIAIHGYAHEHLDRLTKEDLTTFGDNLSRIELSLERLTGKRPVGFRSPYLMYPAFSSRNLYQILASHAYRWISNREIRYPDELFRPDRIPIQSLWGKNNGITRIILSLLNMRMILTDHMTKKKGLAGIIANICWLDQGAAPFERYGLLEVPVYTPLDCDLLGLPTPETTTSTEWIRYATACLVGGINRRGHFYMLNFHDWIIGSSNRLQLLDNLLSYFASRGSAQFITGTECVRLLNNYE
jgi:peptidoglycan/xylan/chitin deacetylase (PgdA/CDA1 family)